jgi:hypothetical protein
MYTRNKPSLSLSRAAADARAILATACTRPRRRQGEVSGERGVGLATRYTTISPPPMLLRVQLLQPAASAGLWPPQG